MTQTDRKKYLNSLKIKHQKAAELFNIVFSVTTFIVLISFTLFYIHAVFRDAKPQTIENFSDYQVETK